MGSLFPLFFLSSACSKQNREIHIKRSRRLLHFAYRTPSTWWWCWDNVYIISNVVKSGSIDWQGSVERVEPIRSWRGRPGHKLEAGRRWWAQIWAAFAASASATVLPWLWRSQIKLMYLSRFVYMIRQSCRCCWLSDYQPTLTSNGDSIRRKKEWRKQR